MMRCSVIRAGLLAVAVSGAVQAQVYESKDAQGNTVYSDTPVPGAKQIELPATSIADPVPQRSSTTESQGAPHSIGSQHGNVMTPGDERTMRQAEDESGERHEVLDADQRHEVLDADSRHEVMGAEPRREVLDAER